MRLMNYNMVHYCLLNHINSQLMYTIVHAMYTWNIPCIDSDNKALDRLNEYRHSININNKIHSIHASIQHPSVKRIQKQ